MLELIRKTELMQNSSKKDETVRTGVRTIHYYGIGYGEHSCGYIIEDMTGGIIDKLGNLYEAKGAVLGLLRVVAGDALSIRYESIDPEEHGVDWFLKYKNYEESVQAKRSATSGKWTIRALEREGILRSAGKWLGMDMRHHFQFVSESAAPDMNGLCENAAHAMDSSSLIIQLRQSLRDDFKHLSSDVWGVTHDRTLDFLQRCRFEVQAESSFEDLIRLFGERAFNGPRDSIFPILRAYIEEHMGLELSTEMIIDEISRNDRLSFRPRLDPALWQQLREANRIFLDSHPTFGMRSPIHRSEADSIADSLSDSAGPRLILLTGNAGSGKSFILKEVVEGLERKAVPHLIFRVDRYLSVRSLDELGHVLLRREENPLVTLDEYAGNSPSVLIIDQIDAVSQISGRSGPIRELVLRLIMMAREFDSIKVITACRSYDLSNDSILKEHAKDKTVLNIQATPLDWMKDVAPLLRERGFDISRVSHAMRSILTSPLNLGILLELGADQDTSSLMECTEVSTLYDKLIFKKCEHLGNLDTVAALTKIARRMSDDQTLEVPDGILEPTIVMALASEQLILHSKSRISFFHETFFDYIYARAFVAEGKSIVEFLKEDVQILFRRTQVRQILSYYRQTTGTIWGRYFTELEEVLNSAEVRYHIKDGIAGWLGSLSDPSEGELDLILNLDTPDSGMPTLVRKAIYPQSSWALILAHRGALGRWLRSPVELRRNDASAILSTLLKTDQARAVGILESYWREAPIDRLSIIKYWLLFTDDIEPSEALVRFICGVVAYDTDENKEQNSLEHIVPYSWLSRYPEIAGRILSAFFAAWLKAHPEDHPFSRNRRDVVPDHVLQELRKGSLEAYLDTVLPVFLVTIARINRKNAGGIADVTFYIIHEGFDFGSDGFLHNIQTSLVELAQKDPSKAAKYLELIDARSHAACLYLHLSTIGACGAELARHFASLLDISGIMEAGPSGATWLPFANAAKSTLPILDIDIRKRIETMILGYWPELDEASDTLQRLRERDKDQYTNKDIAYSYLHMSGNAQWAIFKTIDIQIFSPLARIRFETLDRKFAGATIPEPNRITGGFVPPPILAERASRMSDDQWIRAIENYPSEGTSRRRKERSFYDMHSGAFGLSQVLREQAKAAPERFARFFMRLPTDANPMYGDAILYSLAGSKIDADILLPLFKGLNAERNPGFCSGFCQIVSARPELTLFDEVFELLLWYVKSGPLHGIEEFETQRIQQDMLSVDQLLDGMGIITISHGDRAAAIRALASVIAHCAGRRQAAIGTLRARLVDEDARCIRFVLSEPLLYTLETIPDKHEAIGLLKILVSRARDFDPYPLTNYHGIHLLHRLLYLFPQECIGVVEALLSYPDEKVKEIGAYFAYYQTFISADYSKKFSALLGANREFRYIDAGWAAQFIAEDHGMELAAKKLIDYFDDPDEKTRKSAIQCFRHLNNKPLGPYRELLHAYIHSIALAHADTPFYECIKNAPDCSRDIVIEIGERLLDLFKSNTEGYFRFEAMTIVEMLNKEYPGTANNPCSRTRILDLIDGMLQIGMYGVEEIVEEHDRR